MATTKGHNRLRCYICNRKGHLFQSCNEGFQDRTIATETSTNIRSTPKVSDRDYFPKVYIEGTYMVKGTDSGNWEHIWYVSKTQQQHLAQSKKVLEMFKYKYHAQRLNGQDILVRGIGNARLIVEDEETLIGDILYCPNINVNVLSLNQLWEQGFGIHLEDHKVTLVKRTDHGWKLKQRNEIERQIRFDLEEMSQEAEQRRKDEGTSCNMPSHQVAPNKVTPERLICLMEFFDFILKEDYAYYEFKEDLAKQFEDMVTWFSQSEYSDEKDLSIPLMIGPKKVCLLELYKLVKEAGGAGLITLEKRWKLIAFALGFPDWYEMKIKDGFVRYLQKMDMCYEVMKAAYEYHEIEEENNLVVKDHDTFMKYMDLLQTSKANKYKRMLRNSFEEVIAWFHTELVDGDPNLPMPPKIGNLDLCLYDLYTYLINEGGLDQDDIGWEETALAFGYTENDKYEVKGIAKRYLLMLDVYYRSMKKYEEGGAENDCEGMQASYSREEDLGCNLDSPRWSTTDGYAQDNFEATNANFVTNDMYEPRQDWKMEQDDINEQGQGPSNMKEEDVVVIG